MAPAPAVERRATPRRKSDEICDECLDSIGGWHLDKKISLTHLITTLAILGTGVGYVIQNEKNHTLSAARIDAMHNVVVELKEINLRQDKQLEETVKRIETLIQRSEDKIDKLLANRRG